MKKSSRYTLLLMAVALTAGIILGYGHQSGWLTRDTSDDTLSRKSLGTVPAISPSLLLDSIRQQMANDRKTELDYYLDRHNVSDEGYEMVAAFANGERHRETTDTISVYNVGHWKNKKREGTAISRDSLGRITIGRWNNDTLVSGIRIDSLGTYQGAFTNGQRGRITDAKAEGHGSYMTTDGHYFEGHWEQDLQEGFGLQLLENEVVTILKTGEWQKGVFKGERMNYTTERIYGIDISRYQHGKGRKKYPIYWNKLRISHLGSKSKKQISGVVDYPVSFCFIKSTEGVTIRNPFYAQDYTNARKAGIPIGAYHFFSTKRTGQAQADYFIMNTLFRSGDLPPVLDIEPSDSQIAAMGGSPALWKNIRAWLKAVERRCGVKPILYVNQRFVNKYLPDAPDIMRSYMIWIARYGEYKPGVKLAVWQLSPDGRVKGITGEVDINVFNGYQHQFDEFLQNETIK
ncbi:MAG: GH25 family lysozyme [Prevotella sp.]|jgi:lysozyme|nr:GH25 family lysozyme [Prevotella sp.]